MSERTRKDLLRKVRQLSQQRRIPYVQHMLDVLVFRLLEDDDRTNDLVAAYGVGHAS